MVRFGLVWKNKRLNRTDATSKNDHLEMVGYSYSVDAGSVDLKKST